MTLQQNTVLRLLREFRHKDILRSNVNLRNISQIVLTIDNPENMFRGQDQSSLFPRPEGYFFLRHEEVMSSSQCS